MVDGYLITSGTVDITPQMRIPLAGYKTVRKATFDRVADPLEANVVILRKGSCTIVFVALDLMYAGAYLRDAIAEALRAWVPREVIFIAAAHTHSGPPTEDSLPVLGAVTPEYRSFVARRVIELASRLLNGPLVSVSLEYLEGRASHSVYRRKKVFGLSRSYPFLGWHVRIKPDLAGPRDDVIRMLRIRDLNGKDVAACWSYACHPVGFPVLNDLSAEYPGVVRSMIRASYGDIPVVFWQGFSGNIGPLQLLETHGTPGAPAAYALRARTMKEWRHWATSLGQCVIATAAGQGSPVRGPVSYGVRSLPVRALGLSSGKELCLHEIALGPDLVICGLNAEVAVEYVQVLQQLYAPARVIPVGCVGDVFGYLPVDAMVREGGYEATGFVRRFGLTGRFVPNVSAIVTERLFRCPQETGQSLAQPPGTSASCRV